MRPQTSANQPGTGCTWVIQSSEVNGVWIIKNINSTHNAACLRYLQVSHALLEIPLCNLKPVEFQAKSCNDQTLKKLSKSTTIKEKRTARNEDQDGDSEDGEWEFHEESTFDLRRRKQNHPGNALPSRAARYK